MKLFQFGGALRVGFVDLWASGTGKMNRSWAWMEGRKESDVAADGEANGFRDGEREMAIMMLTTASDGGNRHGTCVELSMKDFLKRHGWFVAVGCLKSRELRVSKLMQDEEFRQLVIFNASKIAAVAARCLANACVGGQRCRSRKRKINQLK